MITFLFVLILLIIPVKIIFWDKEEIVVLDIPGYFYIEFGMSEIAQMLFAVVGIIISLL